MTGYRDLHPKERQSNAIAAKKALVEQLRAASQGPAAEERRKAREALNEERLARATEREAAKAKLKAEQVAEAAKAAEVSAQAQREAEAEKVRLAAKEAERAATLLLEQKVARDARYAARKAEKKIRRRGY